MSQEKFVLPDSYKLVMLQDFSGGNELENWTSPENQRNGGYWSPQQCFVENKKLVIRSQYRNISGKEGYHSGCLIWNKNNFTYGYYEARCRVDKVWGAWSAFWLMPDKIEKGYGYEIDIFECAWNYFCESTLHWNAYRKQAKKRVFMKNLYDGMHTFALDWKKDSLSFYYDNRLVWRVNDEKGKINYPVALMLSTEINGRADRDGKPLVKRVWIGNGLITDRRNDLPSDFVIDYVKVYDNGDLILSDKVNLPPT